MESNHKLCLYVSYYLSRFDMEGYRNLGYSTQQEAHISIANNLVMKPSTVKNMRDEFDPLHGFRAGWHHTPLSPSRAKVVQALENLSEFEIRAVVLDILSQGKEGNADDWEKLLSLVDNNDSEITSKPFILRGPTGKKAEEFFMDYHASHGLPENGLLVDTRDLGTGYDFKIENNRDIYIEVKGLADIRGGILFTSKEWEMARNYGDRYYVAIVSDINNKPVIDFINNPYKKFKARKNIIKTIKVNWSVSGSEIALSKK